MQFFAPLTLSRVLFKQAAGLVHCPGKELTVRFIDIQSQNGTDDCGVFAIAFATALCNDVDPHSLSLEQKEMLRGRRDTALSTSNYTQAIWEKTSQEG